ncbi:hypothetical protein L596_023766 [Steinernema carpocapsae]|uniref:Uncharacterized protein n=1 Tax=Steinernema carpocapsae TaxID=34508 RepID=A0A4U5MEM8_STECR|nr:hypothetical protein L596_023766 [Steinernema carpocapsae]
MKRSSWRHVYRGTLGTFSLASPEPLSVHADRPAMILTPTNYPDPFYRKGPDCLSTSLITDKGESSNNLAIEGLQFLPASGISAKPGYCLSRKYLNYFSTNGILFSSADYESFFGETLLFPVISISSNVSAWTENFLNYITDTSEDDKNGYCYFFRDLHRDSATDEVKEHFVSDPYCLEPTRYTYNTPPRNAFYFFQVDAFDESCATAELLLLHQDGHEKVTNLRPCTKFTDRSLKEFILKHPPKLTTSATMTAHSTSTLSTSPTNPTPTTTTATSPITSNISHFISPPLPFFFLAGDQVPRIELSEPTCLYISTSPGFSTSEIIVFTLNADGTLDRGQTLQQILNNDPKLRLHIDYGYVFQSSAFMDSLSRSALFYFMPIRLASALRNMFRATYVAEMVFSGIRNCLFPNL